MQPKRPTRFYSNNQEKKVAKAVGGRKVANSGACKFNKGDVITDNILIECKTRTSEQSTFTIKRDWILKNREEAFAMHRNYSALAIDFGDGELHYLISQQMFDMLVDLIDKQ